MGLEIGSVLRTIFRKKWVFVNSAWTAIPNTWKGLEQRKKHKASNSEKGGRKKEGERDHKLYRTWRTSEAKGDTKIHRERALNSASMKLEWIKNLDLMNKATHDVLNKAHAQVT